MPFPKPNSSLTGGFSHWIIRAGLLDNRIRKCSKLMINMGASTFEDGHRETRLSVLRANCQKYYVPLLYVNHAGSQTERIFDGGSLALDHQGLLIGELAYFSEDVQFIEVRQPAPGKSHAAIDPVTAGPAPQSPVAAGPVVTPNPTGETVATDDSLNYARCISETSISRIHQALLTGIGDSFR